MGNVLEFWFSKHYRVVITRNNDGSFLASVDIYRKKWLFNDYEELCLESSNTCLIYKVITELDQVFQNVKIEKAIVTGVKIGDSFETINVRWIGWGEVNEDVAKRLFEESWKIVRCEPPSTSGLRLNCFE